jgi:hypothetical protein
MPPARPVEPHAGCLTWVTVLSVSSQRETPRRKAVASGNAGVWFLVATHVRLPRISGVSFGFDTVKY